MAQYDPTRKPTFLWQALLIVLPVVLLAVVGFVSLRQDRLLVQSEAAERAQALARNLVSLVWGDLTAKPQGFETRAFQVDSNGQLLFPPPLEPLPDPQSFKTSALTPAQRGLWLAAQQAEADAADPERAIAAFNTFLKSAPPKNFAGSAHFSLGLLLLKQANRPAAAGEFQKVIDKYPGAIGESGLPLAPLAQLKLLELAKQQSPAAAGDSGRLLDLVCSNAVEHPNPLSAEILGRAIELAPTPQNREAARKWQQRWNEQDSARALYSAAHEHFQMLTGPLLMSEPSAEEDSLGNREQSPTGVAAPTRASLPLTFWFTPPPGWSNSVPLINDGFRGEISGSEPWLAVRCEREATNWYVCRSESEIGSHLRVLVEEGRLTPDYFGVALEVRGRRVNRFAPDLRMWHRIQYMSKGAGQVARQNLDQITTNVLASVTGPETAGPLKALVYLTSPEALFERQAMRTFWFGCLIAVAALAALVGLAAAYRAFSRQLRLSELKSNFVSSVSHELRAPIASVRLLAESLEAGHVSEPAKQHQYFGFIAQECRRLSALVENVLDFSRIEQGRKQYEFEPTDIAGLVEQTVRLMQTYAAEKQVQLKLILPEPGGQIAGLPAPELDGKAIQQALVNLIDNAVKHSPKAGTVRVGLEERSTESDAASVGPLDSGPRNLVAIISIWVEDDGEGIPPEEHDKIFERFYRRGSELRRETQGVGIGLSIVKHIVEAHEGRARVRSAPGQGSRFTLELPIWNAS